MHLPKTCKKQKVLKLKILAKLKTKTIVTCLKFGAKTSLTNINTDINIASLTTPSLLHPKTQNPSKFPKFLQTFHNNSSPPTQSNQSNLTSPTLPKLTTFAMAVSTAAKTAMQKGRVEAAKSKRAKKEAARARAAVAREARVGKKASAAKATPKK
jgi:hypothetical protein